MSETPESEQPLADNVAANMPEPAPGETAVTETTPTAASNDALTVVPDSAVADAQPAPPQPIPSGGGPISLAKIRELRMSQQKSAARPRGSSGTGRQANASSAESVSQQNNPAESAEQERVRPRKGGLSSRKDAKPIEKPVEVAPKVAVPSRRHALPQDLEDELQAALSATDLDKMLVGDSMVQVGKLLAEGQRIQGRVLRSQGEFIFVSLGGPNEGVIPAINLDELPEEGTQLEVVVRGYLESEGLYEVTIPGNAALTTHGALA